MNGVEHKRMYRVEKFLPTECPKCRHRFLEEGKDYAKFLGDIVDGQKRIRESTGYDIIVCEKCHNFTARLMVEAYQLSDHEKAESYLREGFVNLQIVEAFGSHVQDTHEVFTSMPQLRVRVLKLQ